MKKILLLAALACVFSIYAGTTWVTLDPQFSDSAYSVNIIHSDYDSTVIEFSIPGFYYSDSTIGGTTYRKIWLAGMEYSPTSDSGKPMLPSIYEKVGIPPTKAVSISIADSSDTTIADFIPYPYAYAKDTVTVDPDDFSNSGNSGYFFSIDSSFYQSGSQYPDTSAKVSSPKKFMDIRVASVDILPFRFDSSDSSTVIHRNYTVTLAYTGTDTIAAFPDSAYPIGLWDEGLYESHILNFASMETRSGGRPNYVVIAKEDWDFEEPIIQRWLHLREREGFDVKIITLSGSIDHDDVRDAIVTNCNVGDYVVLIGDRGTSLGHSDYMMPIYEHTITDEIFPLDGSAFFGSIGSLDVPDEDYLNNTWYYRALDDEWYPDIVLGRIPAEDPGELITYLNNIYVYQVSDYYGFASEWEPERMTGAASGYTQRELGGGHRTNHWLDYLITGLFPSSGTILSDREEDRIYAIEYPPTLPPVPLHDNEDLEELLDFNNGYGWGIFFPTAFYSDSSTSEEFGYWKEWAAMGSSVLDDWFDSNTDDIDPYLGGSGFIYGHYDHGMARTGGKGSSVIGKIDMTLADDWMFNNDWANNSFATGVYGNFVYFLDLWNGLHPLAMNPIRANMVSSMRLSDDGHSRIGSMIRAKDYGLIGKIETTEPWDPTEYCEDDVNENIKYNFLWADLMSDPAVDIHLKGPDRFAVRFDPLYILADPVSGTSVNVDVVDSDGDVENATVCLWRGDFSPATMTYTRPYKAIEETNASGRASFAMSLADVGAYEAELFVTVTQTQHLTFLGTIIIGGFMEMVIPEIGESMARARVMTSSNLPALLSPPGNMGMQPMDSLFKSAEAVWFLDGDSYIRCEDSIHIPGRAYWAEYTSATVESTVMIGYDTLEYALEPGWNLIGALAETHAWDGNFSSTSEILCGPIGLDNEFAYKFIDDDSLHATKGYWVYVDEACTLTFPSADDDSNGFAENWNYLRDIPNPPNIQDTAHFSVNIDWTNDSVEVLHKETSTAVKNAMVIVQTGNNIEHAYTDSDGKTAFAIDINKSDSTWVFVSKIGFIDWTAHPYGEVANGLIMRDDVYIYGDIAVGRNCTLTIAVGANIYAKPTSADWNYDYDLNNKTEIIAYGGHLIVEGEEDNMVTFSPADGGSGLYQWGGIWAKNSGSFDIAHAQIEYCDGVAGAQGGDNGPGRLKLFKTRHIGNQGVYGDWRNAYSPSGWLQMDSCYIEGRAMWYGTQDSCWAKACSLKGSSTAGESYYVYSCPSDLIFEDCVIFDYSSRGGRLYGQTEFRNCTFDGNSAAAFIYDDGANFKNCDVDANNGSYGLYIGRYADSYGFDIDSTRFYNFSYAGVRTDQNAEFKKFNCFIKDAASYTFYSQAGVKVKTDSCYFDSFAIPPKGIAVDTSNNTAECIPDTSLSKIIGRDGRPIRPEKFSLGNAVPNPFNSAVAVEIDIPKSSRTTFEVFDLLGNKVITLIDEELDFGRYRIVWDGKDQSGRSLPSGTYLYRLRTDEFEETKKTTLIK